MQNYEKNLGEQNIFEDLLPWLAVILYFGFCVFRISKGNQKKQTSAAQQAKRAPGKKPHAKPREVLCVPTSEAAPSSYVPVSELQPAESFLEEGTSDVDSQAAEQQQIKLACRAYSERQKTLRRALIWNELLKTKF